jgi:hypothetical protein
MSLEERAGAIVVLLLITGFVFACAFYPPSRESPRKEPLCEPCDSCPACPPPEVRYERVPVPYCKMSAPPAVPEVTWAPPGCPTKKFGACLSPKDLKLVIQYMNATREWARGGNGK